MPSAEIIKIKITMVANFVCSVYQSLRRGFARGLFRCGKKASFRERKASICHDLRTSMAYIP